jgi:putative FmdB family regulatory protein
MMHVPPLLQRDMPIYEFKCSECGQVMEVLVPGYTVPDDITCRQCGSGEVKKMISKGNYHQSGSDRLSSYDPTKPKSDSFYKDSRNIGLHAEQMLRKAGVKPTEEFKNKIERLRTNPGSVLKDNE